MTFVSYAQNFEDVLLWRALRTVPAGFYIDVGASHPDSDSVTRAFYDRGWHGINVEPTEANHRRLLAARPRDTNLRLAVAAAPGTATFFSVDDANTGLSTLEPAAAARYAELGIGAHRTEVQTETLANICRAHAPPNIHFLKVDVEGAERAVLQGADFAAFRPWITLVEATAPMSTAETHADWEPILLAADYRFAWFDGLNRWYVAAEHASTLLPSFRTPPNIFDDFLRAADTDWTRRMVIAENRADAATRQLHALELRAARAEDRSEAAHLHLARARVEAARATALADRHAEAAAALEHQAATLRTEAAVLAARLAENEAVLDHTTRSAQGWEAHAAELDRQRQDALAWLRSTRGSTSWRITAPLRRLRTAREAEPTPIPAPPPPPPIPEPPQAAIESPPAPPPEPPTSAPRPLARAVHQFHSGTATGDAITNAMLLTRRLLRQLGYDSRIFAEHRDPALAHEIHGLDDLPGGNDYVLIVRHSMGHGALDRILALPARKILLYHNITPPELLDGDFLRHHSRLGRQQLSQLRPAVDAALADSEYNALELRQLGFPIVAACTLLFDLQAMLAEPRRFEPTPRFTVLFVGRVAPAKGQLDLLAAFAEFRTRFSGECRLVLVGRHEPGPYLQSMLEFIQRHDLGRGAVDIAGPVSDAELRRHYAEADLYLSLSRHEGFGVPLVEAAARGVPVLALDAGATAYTLTDPADPTTIRQTGLLPDALPATVATALLHFAADAPARQALAAYQARSVSRFALSAQLPALCAALARAGAAPPADSAARAALAANARFTVAGHVNGSYSLAEITRTLAADLSARLLPVEGDATTQVSGIPAEARPAIAPLLARPAPEGAPHVVVSHHYPVWVPPEPGDVPLSLFFWEESLVPPATVAVLNDGFRGVVAPSRPVARALLDSGLRIPVRVIPPQSHPHPFQVLQDERPARAGRPFTFLHVSSCFPRKGVDVLLAAWARAFSADDPVHLVVKGFPNPHNTVAADLQRLRQAHPALAPVTLLDQDLPHDALRALYRDADAMVLPSRGEGYNLPAAEALAAGLPLIVTAWGGHADFLPDHPAVRRLRFRFAPAATHLSTPFSLWAEPDEDDLVSALRDFAAAPPEPPPEPESVPGTAGRYAAFAADLLLAPPPRPLTLAWITTWNIRCGIAEYARHLLQAVDLPGNVLSDLRTENPEPTVLPIWPASRPGDVVDLMGAVVRTDPRAVVIQHQPGLFPWNTLPGLLNHPALNGRVVCITLHNTQDLADAPPDTVAAVLAALRRLSRVVVHTVRDMNTLLALGLWDNTALIPQGGDPTTEPPTLPDPTPDEPVLIGSYGFFLPGKGLPELITALSLLRQHWPHARLLLVNAEYPLPPSAFEVGACVDLVRAAGLEHAVEFHTGFLPHAESLALLRRCHAVALPYQTSKEGSSAALRTALSAGVPVAVTPLPIFEEAATATTVLPGTTPAAIAAGLDALLRDPAARAATVSAAATWLDARSWPSVGRRWRGMLEALHASGVVLEPE